MEKKVEKHLIFCWLLEEKSRIRIRKSVARIRGSGSVIKCHESATLL
jgi:hypothetical protein